MHLDKLPSENDLKNKKKPHYKRKLAYNADFSDAPPTGLEPVTSWLTVMRSTDWAMEEYIKVGISLFSRGATTQVFSAPLSLTSVFGMGTGVPSTSAIPTILAI